MTRGVAVQRPALTPAAVGHLAHDLRGSIHVIRGHAELLHAEASNDDTRDSAGFIFDACGRLSAVCEDLIDYLRLPAVAPSEAVEPALDELGASLNLLAADRAIAVLIVGPDSPAPLGRVEASAFRVVSHVLEYLVRNATTDVLITVSIDPAHESIAYSASPAPVTRASSDDVILAMAGELLAARGGRMSVADDRIDLTLRVVMSS